MSHTRRTLSGMMLVRHSRNAWLDPDFIGTVLTKSRPGYGITYRGVEIRTVGTREVMFREDYESKSPILALRRFVSTVTALPMSRISIHKLSPDYYKIGAF
jgi:hypothetical protein